MASITITVSPEAHARLKSRKEPNDSFTDVILREVPPPPARNAGELLEAMEHSGALRGLDADRLGAAMKDRKRRSHR